MIGKICMAVTMAGFLMMMLTATRMAVNLIEWAWAHAWDDIWFYSAMALFWGGTIALAVIKFQEAKREEKGRWRV